MAEASKRASARAVDFTNVKEGGQRFNTKRLPAGDYQAVIKKVEDSESKKDGEFQWLFTIGLTDHPSAMYPYYCKLVENQLWKVRNILQAAGITVPRRKVKLDPEKVVGKVIGISLEDDEYEGKLKSVIAAVFAWDGEATEADDDEDDEDEEEETPPPAKKKRPAPEPEDDDEDEDEDEDEEEEPAPRKEKKAAAPEPSAKKKKAKPADDDLDELDIDDV